MKEKGIGQTVDGKSVTWSKDYEMASLNRFAMICYVLITGALFILQTMELANGKKTVVSLLISCVLQWGPLIASYLIYKNKQKGFPYIMDILGIGYATFYTVELFVSTNQMAFLYVIPILIIVMCYANLRFSVVCSSGVVVVNLIHEAYYYFHEGYTDITDQ